MNPLELVGWPDAEVSCSARSSCCWLGSAIADAVSYASSSVTTTSSQRALKEVSVALEGACLPLPSLSFAFCVNLAA